MAAASDTFHLLDPAVQRWIYEQGWTELRDAQEKAAAPILGGSLDVIIAAATASGKTEAAFLPICSRLLSPENSGGCVLYVSPLKALINDQSDRMERLCENLKIPVHPWHGDISQGRKREFLKQPSGILLITPESLEAIFVNRGPSVASLFSKLLYVIVDELHSFIGTERGQQLQSLLRRVEHAIGRRVPRIALSATLGDMTIAASFLRPHGSDKVQIVVSGATGQELKLLVRGYRIT
ncbi:MAG: DEAD/DEAH box helicase, partial [Bryobacteraceae bacterium]